MIYGEIKNFLSTFIECDTIENDFDYTLNECSSDEQYNIELKKFNKLYNLYFIHKGKLVYCINNYNIVLNEKVLQHLLNLYFYYRKHNPNNCYLIAEFLLSYFNTINSAEYKSSITNYKDVRNDFKKVVLLNNKEKNILKNLKDLSFELYNKIIDYGVNKKKFFLGNVLERSLENFSKDELYEKELVLKFLENNVHPSRVIVYDENVKENFKFYENYLLKYKEYSAYSMFPEEMLVILDKEELLNNKIIKTILNQIIERTNMIQDKCLDSNENFIQIIAEIDDTKNFLNFCLNRLKMLSKIHKDKIHECLINLLYLKRCIVSDQEKMNSQMQEFKYEQIIPNEEIDKFVNSINDNLVNLFSSSVCNFEKELKTALNNYSEHPMSYVFSSYNIDSSSQTYLKSEEGFVESVFMNYYDNLGKKITKEMKNLKNVLSEGYYIQMMKYLKHSFLTTQNFIISFFNIKEGKRSLIDKLISGGNYSLKNDYVILAMNVQQIENSLIEILKLKGRTISKSGFDNLNELAKEYYDDKYYMNGLMYINYILYEKHGLNIRNNISHGNYFNKNVEIEIMTTLCSIMFLNGLLKKEGITND